MAKPRKFIKVFVICEDNKLFGNSNYSMVEMIRERKHANEFCKTKQRNAMDESTKMWNKGREVSKYTVHGFYLVHESYFDDQQS